MRHGLGRVFRRDQRDHDYAIHVAATKRRRRYWRDDRYSGNQGDNPTCVGYAWMHWLVNQPIVQWIKPEGIYHLAKLRDPWPGEDYDGTTVRAGAKVLAELGFIEEYRWAWDAETVANTILTRGPVVLGIDWYETMDDPDPAGLLYVAGDVVGGHAILANGFDSVSGLVRLKNSWEPSWGDNGHGYLRYDDLAKLMARDGEACLALEKRVKVPPKE